MNSPHDYRYKGLNISFTDFFLQVMSPLSYIAPTWFSLYTQSRPTETSTPTEKIV